MENPNEISNGSLNENQTQENTAAPNAEGNNPLPDMEQPNTNPYSEQPNMQPPPPYYVEMNKPLKQRRVGTFTLGLTLIIIGIIIPLTMLFPENALMILQFAPIVLVMLGIEVLIYAFRYKEGKLKYDGFSIFLVIMITIVSVGTATVVPVVTKYVESERVIAETCYQKDTLIEKALIDNNLNGSCNVYQDYEDYRFAYWKEDVAQIQVRASVYIEWDASVELPTNKEIAQKLLPFIQDVSEELKSLDVQINYDDYHTATFRLERVEMENVSEQVIINSIDYRAVANENGEVEQYVEDDVEALF